MKNLVKHVLPAIIVLFGCDNNYPLRIDGETEVLPPVTTDVRCGKMSAKFVKTWCGGDLAVIDILSDNSLGEKWTWYKTYPHAVLALLDSTLSTESKGWSGVTSSSDSVFYFHYYTLDELTMCKMCCPPDQIILITSFGARLCP